MVEELVLQSYLAIMIELKLLASDANFVILSATNFLSFRHTSKILYYKLKILEIYHFRLL
jgi:hypothetical protein